MGTMRALKPCQWAKVKQIRAAKTSGQIVTLQQKWFGLKMDLADQPPVFS